MSGTQSISQSGLRAGTRNNICAFLDESGRNAEKFAGIIKFLKRSRIFRAISTECTAYFSHQKDFWENAVIEKIGSKSVIKSKVLGRDIMVSSDIIRQVLGFGDADDQPFVLNKYLVRGCFLRCKYDGDIEKGVLNKGNLSIEYKYLAHVLQHCLSPRKAGHDEMNEKIQSAFAALVLNIPFNFSEMIFHYIKENMSKKKDKYLMYARFLQIIINEQAADLPKDDSDKIPLEIMNDMTMNRLLSYKNRAAKPPMKRLICHLADEDYVFPGGKRWRHNDSDSDVEDMQITELSDDDNDQQEGRQPELNVERAVGRLVDEAEEEEEENVDVFELRKRKERTGEEGSQKEVDSPKRRLKRQKFKLVKRAPVIPSTTAENVSVSDVPPTGHVSQSQQPSVTPPTSQLTTSSQAGVSIE